uniref:Chitin-binding type-2 domain-containing protein n=1 Tax=Meloidogyne hapla TaxID=6305 RepID=A0A1I8BWP7_MELHA
MGFLIYFLLILSKCIFATKFHQPCNDTQPNFLANGPCEKFLTFCDGGLPYQYECPDSFFFNPASKFCERPEDFIQRSGGDDNIPTQTPNIQQKQLPTTQSPPMIVPTAQPPPLVVLPPFQPLPVVEPLLTFPIDDGGVYGDYQHFLVDSGVPSNLPFVGYLEEDDEVPSVFLPPSVQDDKPSVTYLEEDNEVPSVFLPPLGQEERFISSGKASAFAPLNSPADVGHDAFRPSPPLSFVQSGFAPINAHVDLGHDIFNTRGKRSTNDIEKCLGLLGNYSKNSNKTTCTHDEIPSGCRQFYFACLNGTRVQRYCPFGLFFNPLREMCQRREQIQICLPPSIPSKPKPLPPPKVSSRKQIVHSPSARPVLPSYAQYYPERFCSELPDGFYKHPRNHSRIIQCFGHQLFEYPPCLHGLVFNEVRGVCDYADNLPNSVTPVSSASSTKNVPLTVCSGGHNHGDHVVHPEKCSSFYRCVWGRLYPMTCPHGTAFNPHLSVCDYPKNVPNCK